MAINTVIFDLGGVVFRYDPQTRLQQFAAFTGETAETVRKRLIDSGYSQSCDLGRFKGERAYREGLHMLGHRMTMEHFRNIWISVFEPNEEVVALVRRLKTHAAIALMTNNSDLVKDGLEAAYPEVLELFRPRLYSSDLGVMKPDPRLYQIALNLMNSEPAETLFIDDAAKHIAGAQTLGLVTHHFRSAEILEKELTTMKLL
ncbi:MAG: HAD family phosphatase [Gammaproteobacteria bacterium]|nr:HAD family phosphatase [Pseudomonadota bacterium]TDJ39015.1 MAG: HAD family phosphatase [Gammaproteobacteria bacterium]